MMKRTSTLPRKRPVRCADCARGTILYVRHERGAICPDCAGLELIADGVCSGLPVTFDAQQLYVRVRAGRR